MMNVGVADCQILSKLCIFTEMACARSMFGVFRWPTAIGVTAVPAHAACRTKKQHKCRDQGWPCWRGTANHGGDGNKLEHLVAKTGTPRRRSWCNRPWNPSPRPRWLLDARRAQY